MAKQVIEASRVKEMLDSIVEFNDLTPIEEAFLTAMGDMMEQTKVVTIIELSQACNEYFIKHYN